MGEVMEARAPVVQAEVSRALMVLTTMPARKRERVFKMFSLLKNVNGRDEFNEITDAIAEIIAKASGEAPPGGKVVDLEEGISVKSKKSVAVYHQSTGDAIRRRREALRLTQEELAVKSGLPQSHICRLEVGKHAPTRKTIEKIAAALKTTPGKIDLLYNRGG